MAARKGWILGIIIFSSMILLIFVIFFMMAKISARGDFNLAGIGSKIALIELKGVIYNSRPIVRQFEKYRKDESVKAVVFRIDSPGGGVAESQEIYEAAKKTREAGKVVVASMGSVAASGGYYVACGTDTIVANPGTTTGSIGVIAEIPNAKRLLEKIGIDFTVIKSGQFKDTGSPFKEMTPTERKYLQSLIDDAFEQFASVVATERRMSREEVSKIADGRVFTGQQAKENGLIDVIGTYQDAIDLAATMAGLTGEPKLIREKREKFTLFDLLFLDLGEKINSLQSWPRIKYLMMY